MTNKQRLFANEYLVDLNATRAYKAAYKTCKKDETARVNGSKLLTNANVAAYIQERMKAREKRTEITQDKVLNELARIAFGDGSDYAKIVEKEREEPVYDENGELLRYEKYKFKAVEFEVTDNLSDDKKAALSCIKETKFGLSVERYDKLKALELIGKHLGMFVEKIELDGNMVVFKGEDNLED